jgi:hypothetical protein
MFAAILLVCSSVCYADAADVPDITMTVLESEDAAERVISEIKLPEKAASMAQERAAKGLDTANEARERERGREFAQDRVKQARQDGKKNPDKPGKPDKPKKDKD